MDFAFTDEQAMIAETVQSFFSENATSERTRKAMAADGFDRDLWTAFCQELGLAGAALPEEFGGAGACDAYPWHGQGKEHSVDIPERSGEVAALS